MANVYLGLGSNLGDRLTNLHEAITRLQKFSTLEKFSSVMETNPLGGPPQGKYLNLVAHISTNLSPHELLENTQRIELQLGRIRTVPNAARTIDIDLLLYDDLTILTPELTIPHPRMHERPFVMQPLRELNPFLVQQLEKTLP